MREYIDSTRKKECLDILKDLVELKTDNKKGEKEAVTYIATVLRKWGFENTKTLETSDGRLSLICKIEGCSSATEKSLLLNGHVDVVPSGHGWGDDAFKPTVNKKRLYGRGTSDMKGGLASMMEALAIIRKEGVVLSGDLLFTVTADEEETSIGAKELVNSGELEEANAVIIAEPTNLNLVVAEKGAFWVKFVTTGRSSHGSRPSDGINAIEAIHDLISLLKKLDIKHQKHQLLGKSTMNIGTIKGGERTNIVPDMCEVTVDFRLIPQVSPKSLQKQFEEFVNSIEDDYPGLKVEWTTVNNRPAIENKKDEKFVNLLQNILSEDGMKSSAKGVSYYSDASILVPNLGIPFAILGPGNQELAHQTNEYIETPKVHKATQFFIQAITQYLGSDLS